MEEMLKAIAEAECEAVKIKEAALEQAAKIVADAEARAAELEKQAEAECKAYRVRELKAAEERAQSDYEKALAVRRAEAEKYADGLLLHTDSLVKKIAGRICGDR